MDELLLKKAQLGDPDAFTVLMTDYESFVWRVCWHYIGVREDASDCAQEAMVKIWRGLSSFRFDCAFETWVYRIAANCCMDFLRRTKRRPESPLDPLTGQGFDPPDPSPGPEDQAVRQDEHARLREAIVSLPEDQRDALSLTQLEGKSYEETARMLGVSEGTVKSRVNRARGRLKDMLGRRQELLSERNVQRDESPPRAHGKSERREDS